MSTRCNIVLKDSHNKLFFYRHSDGYPSGALPPLKIFMKWLNEGKIRNNVEQAGGWLIILGAIEYGDLPTFENGREKYGTGFYGDLNSIANPSDWKVGSIEPAVGIQGDIEYLHIIDLTNKTLKSYDQWDDKGNGLNEVSEDE